MSSYLIGYGAIGVTLAGLASVFASGRIRPKDVVTVAIAWPILLVWFVVHRRRGLRPVSSLAEFNVMIHTQAQKHERPVAEVRKRYGHYAPTHLFVPLAEGEDRGLCAICMQTPKGGEHLGPLAHPRFRPHE